MRWSRPGQGLVEPLNFIAVAEECGLILPIGRWVMATACADAMRWQGAGQAICVAVNLSAVRFRDPDLAGSVAKALAHSGLSAGLLEIEFTESAAGTIASLKALRASGIQLAMDDFGTGYSSLSYLKRRPLTMIKIDRSFILGLPDDHKSCATVNAILAMTKSLGLKVKAEGVERLGQAMLLRDMGCDQLQGYYFSKPVPAAEIPELLTRSWSWPEIPHVLYQDEAD